MRLKPAGRRKPQVPSSKASGPLTRDRKEITPVSTVPLERPVAVGHFTAEDGASLRALLERVYCTGMGFEIAHLPSAEMAWMADKIETVCTMNTSAAMRERIATTLVTAEAFEAFMQKRFSQVKRYGFEGCESVAVALDILLQAVTDGTTREQTCRWRSRVLDSGPCDDCHAASRPTGADG